MTIAFQQLRSAIPGAQPSQLDVGQLAFNVSDGTMYLGTGGDTRIDFSGAPVLPNPPAGKGWIQFLLERAALEEFFLSNPTSEGGLPPENEQVLTWNAAANRAEWQEAGTGFAYFTTNAAVAAAPGATTNQKITSAIGSPAHIGDNATCVVDGAPGTTYQGLYIYNGTEWKFAAQFSFPLANQVPGVNPMDASVSNVQLILDALKVRDDDLQTAINANSSDISTLQGEMAQAQTDILGLEATKLNKASNIPTAGQILSYDGTGQLWVDDAQGDVTGVSGTAPITVNNADPQTPVIGINAATLAAPGAVQLNDNVNSTSVTQAGTARAVKEAYDAGIQGQVDAGVAQATADAAVPRASYTDAGDILVGNGAGTFGALGVGAEGQILTVNAGLPAWTTDSPGDVTTVSATAPITVDNTDPQNPVIGVDLATTATPGVVQVELTGNLTLVGGVINVPDASTTVKGAVQLNNTLSSNSTTQALTAAKGLDLQGQINALTLAANTILAGGYDASTGLVDGATAAGTAQGFIDGNPPPAPAAGNTDFYLVCIVSGNNPSPMENGDWLYSDGTQYIVLGVGARPASASYTQAGIVQLADADAVVDGTSDTLAITPQALQDNVIDAVNVANSSQIASATAVKTAYDAAVAAQTSADNAQTTANAALPKAGGTMTGTLTSTDINVQATYSIQFAGGINGTLDGITDSTSTTDSTVAASATAAKAAYDAAQSAAADSLPLAGGIMTGDIEFLTGSAYGILFYDGSFLDNISDSVSTTDSTMAASATAVKAAYDAAVAAQSTADAAIPESVITATGDIIYGSAAGTAANLGIGTAGQVLKVVGGLPAWANASDLTGYTNTATPFNTALGNNAGDSITSGTGNTAVGYNAGTAVTTGSNNTLIGYNTGDAINTGVQNTGVGVNALGSATSVNSTVAVGYNALAALTTGANNTALGSSAGSGVTTGVQNTLIGTSAGDAITNGTNHVAVGYNAVGAAVSSTSNVGVGTNALQSSTGNNNVAVGTNAGGGNTSGALNVYIGHTAGDAVTTGSNNTIIGDIAGSATLTDNLILGAGTNIKLQVNENGAVGVGTTPSYGTAGQVLTSQGSGAVPTWTTLAVGDITAVTAGSGLTGGGTSGDVTLSLDSSAVIAPTLLTATGDMIYASAASTPARLGIGTSGQILSVSGGVPTWITASGVSLNGFTNSATPFNTALGYQAGNVLTSNSVANTAVGYQTLDAEVSGDYNTALGHIALGSQNGASGNTALGANAGGAITTGSDNTFVGYGAGDATTLSTGSVAIGKDALGANYTQVGAVAVGLNAMLAATSAARSTAVGYASMDALTTGSNNTAVGYSSLGAVTTGTDNTAVGNDALLVNTGSFNTAVGSLAADAITSGSNNVSIGYSAHGSAATPASQVAIGKSALQSSGATGSVAVGFEAGLNSSSATVTAIGYNALRAVTVGTANTAVGLNAGAVYTGSRSVFIGHNAGDVATTGNSNIFIGADAGGAVTLGATNIFIGDTAGDAVTTGFSNTIIGDIAGSTTLSNNLILGAGNNIKLQVNENNAVGVADGLGGLSYGTAGQVLQSNGAAAAPTWVTPAGGLTGVTDAQTTALGSGALTSEVAGVTNTALGVNAGTTLVDGDRNTFVGYNAGQSVLDTLNNTFIGHQAGINATGDGNTSVGAFAGPTGAALTCTFVGQDAGSISSGNNNVGVGASALSKATGGNNTAYGSSAGQNVTTGTLNTFIGFTAGSAVTTGSSNTILGDVNGTTTLSNNLILAAGTTIKLQVNENGAVGVGSTPAYGTSQQVLTSAGTGAAPTWVTPVWLPLTPQTLTTTTPTTILTLPIATFRGVAINISASDATAGRFHNDGWMVIHDGASVSVQNSAPGAHIGGVAPYSLSATISGADLLIQVTSASTNSTKYVGAYETFAI